MSIKPLKDSYRNYTLKVHWKTDILRFCVTNNHKENSWLSMEEFLALPNRVVKDSLTLCPFFLCQNPFESTLRLQLGICPKPYNQWGWQLCFSVPFKSLQSIYYSVWCVEFSWILEKSFMIFLRGNGSVKFLKGFFVQIVNSWFL